MANWNLLNVDWNIEASLSGTTFDLIAVGDMETVLFGTAYIFEEDSKICDGNNNAGNCDRANTNELDNLDITAMLGISSPLISSEDIPGNALAFESELNDSHNDLEVTFDAILVNFGIGGHFRVELLDGFVAGASNTIAFDDNEQTRSIYAKFTLLSPPTEAALPNRRPSFC